MNTVESTTASMDDVLIFCNSPAGAQRVIAGLQAEFPTKVFHLRDCDVIYDQSDAWVHRRALELAVDHKAMWVYG